MNLKRLELSGFKSFAKRTALEFPSSITAIVGPNGSGKSNVKEAIQWVFGEQSLKSLRGKRGEDLIWNGSHAIPRTGKATVALAFDNVSGKVPIAFDEVVLERSFFRDGAGEYALNGSPARLRDITEIAAHLGIGETHHNIIGQGEVDRMLAASPRMRRSMFEDALGLGVYQLKKEEAERKLAATNENMERAQAILQELEPHAAFLRSQAKKAELRGRLLEELRAMQALYFTREKKEVEKERARIESEKKPLASRSAFLKGKIDALTESLFRTEKEIAAREKEMGNTAVLVAHQQKRRELEHEIGRLEGKIETAEERLKNPRARAIDMEYVKAGLHAFLKKMRSTFINPSHENLAVLISDLEQFLAHIEKGAITRAPDQNLLREKKEWEERARLLRQDMENVSHIAEQEQEKEKEFQEAFRRARTRIRDCDSELRMAQDAEREVRFRLDRLSFEEERISARNIIYAEELMASGIGAEELTIVETDGGKEQSQNDLKTAIDRMQSRIAALGSPDPAVLQEFQETETRVSFLKKELEDVKQASQTLHDVIKTLTREMDHIFQSGFEKIQEEFRAFFRIIFGGGKGELVLARSSIARQKNDVLEEGVLIGEEEQTGIDISVHLPRKRIRGLAMLSGGERALASLAFLFAITAVNPAPFLILDEADAAFDEANSKRYGALLKELAKRTQLILITHNRETMKVADVLYGITMGDDGASKLLSIRLAEAEGYAGR